MKVRAVTLFAAVVLLGSLGAPPVIASEASSAGPGQVGQWASPVHVGVVGIHAALLHTGKVLLWQYPGGAQGSAAALYDPATGTITDVTVPFPRDIFCAGLSILPDGRVFVAGGMNDNKPNVFAGTRNATIFDPATETWSSGASMAKARWYPTTVVMPDGTILTLSGLDQNGQNVQRVMESYDPATNTWTTLPPSANILRDLFPRMVVLPDGTVFNAGSDADTHLFHPSTNSWSFVDNLLAGYRGDDGTVLLPGLQRVLVAGGLGSGPLASAEVIDFSASHPQWTYTGSMAHARYNLNLVLLADGTALAVGGNQKGSYKRPVRSAELYDPNTAQWSVMASQQAIRGYHSTALLLPDGRVISAGSDSRSSLSDTVEIYSPPYLFHGPRPTITGAPGAVGYGQDFTISTPDASGIARVALVRAGATTHANDFDQRYVDLAFTQSGAGTITATSPGSSNTAPPGWYMLFILNPSGVPAVATFVHLG